MHVPAKEQPDSAGISVLNRGGIAAYPSIQSSDKLDLFKTLTVIEAPTKKEPNLIRIALSLFSSFVDGVDLGIESILW